MENIKYISKDKREILERGDSILYSRKNELGNLIEKEVIKFGNKFYRVSATNKRLTEFVQV